VKKKNIVVILCDQLRKDFLSCYGFKGLHTPNIDRLANDGVLFENAFTASPVCAPGRACMMTGRYVSDHQVFTNDVPFRDGLEYLAERFNKLGYQTGAFGKLHHFPAKDTKGFHTAFRWKKIDSKIKMIISSGYTNAIQK
jgi:arylsulfatase A-like enzyme